MKSGKQNVNCSVYKIIFIACSIVCFGANSFELRATENQDSRILPQHPVLISKIYGELASAWWQWALSIPESQNPLLDTTGQFAGVGQRGPVWFLAGTFGNSAERTVQIPRGRFIFMPVHNWIFGAGVFDCDPTVPGVPCDVNVLREKAASAATAAEILEVWIDGKPVPNVRKYRAFSPRPFSITLPQGAVFGIPAGTYFPQVADGYWLLLAPFSKGEHTIRVHVVNSAAEIDMTVTTKIIVQ